jgi:hypothetical protein
MKKQEIIKEIVSASEIHHNISISFSKMPDYTDEDNFDWNIVAEDLLEDFVRDMQYEKINDKGNRNLCGCNKVICTDEDFKKNNGYNGRSYIDHLRRWVDKEEAKKLGILNKRTAELRIGFTADCACKKHDLWHFYTTGRSGATLYWDKYWKDSNRGLSFGYEEYELEEMPVSELKDILKELQWFNKEVAELMEDFYSSCEYGLEESRKEKLQEEQEETEYQKTKELVKEKGYIKRLVSDII